jgi:hypothetical protein
MRGRGLVAQLVGWLFGFPEAGDDVPLTFTVTRTPERETWERNFAGRRLVSVLTPSRRPFRCWERFGPFAFEVELLVEDGVMHFLVRRGWLLGVPLPAMLLPRSCSRELAVDGVFRFDIGIYAPLSGSLMVSYQGWLRSDAA